MTPRAKVAAGALLVAAFVALGIGQRALDASARATLVQAPRFEVDPLWPKPLPNHWVLGNVIGVGVDANDHVFIVHRNDTFDARNEIGAAQKPPLSECCVPAPPVLEFDPAGNLVKAWGGPPEDKQYVWPSSNHGISIDNKNNVWIGGNGGRGDAGSDSHILKFTHDGKFLMQIGDPGQPTNSNSTTHFGRVAKISFDVKANEAFIADGYGNKRVAVLDMDNGQDQALLGRVRPRALGLEPRPLRPERSARAAVPKSGALRRADAGRAGVRVRPRERPHSGVPRRAASS